MKSDVILKHYREIIEERKFDEYDILGFMIFIRKFIERDNGLKRITDFANLIAHRDRNRGIAMDAIQGAIDNNYRLKDNSREVEGYQGIQYSEWDKEWCFLGKIFNIRMNNAIIKEIGLCFISLAQDTIYTRKEDGKDYYGKMDVFCFDNKISLSTNEGHSKSLQVIFFVIDGIVISDGWDCPHLIEGVETKRINGDLKLFYEGNIVVEGFVE